MSALDEFKLSTKVKELLKDREKMKREIAKGKSLQDIIDLSDEAMGEFYKAAYKLFENRHFVNAADAFLFLVTINPNIPEYWIGLGMATQMCGDYETAVDAYEMAAMYEIENPVPYFYLAKCLFELHERDSTLQALDLAIEYAGDNEEYEDLKKQAIAAKKLLAKK